MLIVLSRLISLHLLPDIDGTAVVVVLAFASNQYSLTEEQARPGPIAKAHGTHILGASTPHKFGRSVTASQTTLPRYLRVRYSTFRAIAIVEPRAARGRALGTLDRKERAVPQTCASDWTRGPEEDVCQSAERHLDGYTPIS